MQDTQIKIVELKGITKKYPFVKILNADTNSNFEKFYALKEVSLDVKQGEVLGVIGRNGAGKTTLLNIIAGTLSPTEGEIFLKGRLMGLFNLGVGFQDELSGKENIFLNGTLLGAKTKEIESKLSSIIEFSELDDFIKMPLGSYSQGMRLRLGFSIVANLDFDILVIDEILAVGDTVFQNKCFERLMDFRRSRKTLIITNQNMDLIERLCDKVVLLDHGHLLFYGNTLEGINKYRALLNTEKFFVGPKQKNISLVETTKKWADDISCWYKKLGTKEAIIESVEFINKFGYRCNRIRSRDSLRIKVNLTLRDKIKDPHFGIAIFREDGVYCYGPNTAFDGYRIPSLDKCRGHFTLNYQRLLLAPGEYRVSVAIWDRNETLAFDYHNGYYKLIVGGYHNSQTELVKIDFKIKTQNWIDKLAFFKKRNKCIPNLSLLKDKWGQKLESKNIRIESVKFLNSEGQEKNIFMTNNFLKLSIKFLELCLCNKDSYLWLGIYRDDGIYCQGIIIPLNRNKEFQIIFPKLPLLPGSYKISIGVWDELEKHFLMHHHGIYCFRTVYNRQDHGTVCLEHSWKWKLSKIK